MTISSINEINHENFHLQTGLDNFKNINLSFTEKEAIREFVEKRINDKLNPAVAFMEQFTGGNLDNLRFSNVKKQQLIELDNTRRELIIKLAELKMKKCQLMNDCTDKSAIEKYSVKVLSAKYKSAEIKSNTIRKFLQKEIVNRTPHSTKAIREIEGEIDKALQKKNQNSN